MLTENQIRNLTIPQTFSRGQDYYHSGAVVDLVRRGDTLTAEVEGSHGNAYQVTIQLDDAGDIDATCTCPYDWGGYCKHIVAVLLAAAHNPDDIEAHPPVETLLADLDAAALRSLLVDLLTRQPDLIAWVESQLPRFSHPTTAGQKKPSVDTQAVRRLVRSALRTSHEYYATASTVNSLNSILHMAQDALDKHDAAGALAIVEMLANETIPGWEDFDDSDGEFGAWFSELGTACAEALLSIELSAAERAAWVHKLETWQSELDDYGVDEAFDLAVAAATYGWDAASLREKLAEQTRKAADVDEAYEEDEEAYEDEDEEGYVEDEEDSSWRAKDLTRLRLNVLARQGRIDEFLNLAAAEGEIERYATMLVTAGRIDEAVDYGLHHLHTPGEALALARALHQAGDTAAALGIAEHALGLPGDGMRALAPWLRDLAMTREDHALALRAARQAFLAESTLANYRAVQPLAGDNWQALKSELLAHLAALGSTFEGIDIYLAEGMVDAAVRAADALPYAGHTQIAKVARAAVQSHPDWVIRHACQQAESIMNAGNAPYYSSAYEWLLLAKQAYQAAGRGDVFRHYVDALLTQHARKYKLVPFLRKL